MKDRFLCFLISITTLVSAAQGQAWKTPRTPDGRPDLQGYWANNNATPLERMPGAMIVLNHIRGLIDFGFEPLRSFWANLLLAVAIALLTANLMVIAGEAWGPWVEIPLPFVLGALWVLALPFAVGTELYFALSLAPLLVGLSVLALPHGLRGGGEHPKKHGGKA